MKAACESRSREPSPWRHERRFPAGPAGLTTAPDRTGKDHPLPVGSAEIATFVQFSQAETLSGIPDLGISAASPAPVSLELHISRRLNQSHPGWSICRWSDPLEPAPPKLIRFGAIRSTLSQPGPSHSVPSQPHIPNAS